MKTRVFVSWLILLAVAVLPSVMAGEAASFDGLLEPYEATRLAMLDDDFGAVAAPAQRMVEVATALADGSDDPLYAEIRNAARDVAAAANLDAARTAYGTLSRGMVKLRQQQADPSPVVVYCAMAEQVWLQPKGEIGNPYYGQSMARCGEIVSE